MSNLDLCDSIYHLRLDSHSNDYFKQFDQTTVIAQSRRIGRRTAKCSAVLQKYRFRVFRHSFISRFAFAFHPPNERTDVSQSAIRAHKASEDSSYIFASFLLPSTHYHHPPHSSRFVILFSSHHLVGYLVVRHRLRCSKRGSNKYVMMCCLHDWRGGLSHRRAGLHTREIC